MSVLKMHFSASDTVELHHHGHSAVSSHKNNGANAKDKN